MRDFLWSKFWTGLVPVLLLTECLTIAANELLGVDPFLKRGGRRRDRLHELRARRPRHRPRRALSALHRRQPQQVAGSYGGVAFMILAVLFIIVIDRAARLAVVRVPRAAVPRGADEHIARRDDVHLLWHRRDSHTRDVLAGYAIRRPGPRRDGPRPVLAGGLRAGRAAAGPRRAARAAARSARARGTHR